MDKEDFWSDIIMALPALSPCLCPFALGLSWVLLLFFVSGVIFNFSVLPTPCVLHPLPPLHPSPLITTLVGIFNRDLLLTE